MYGYIRQGRRTALTRETIGGVPFWVLTAGQGRLRRPPAQTADGRLGERDPSEHGDALIFSRQAFDSSLRHYGLSLHCSLSFVSGVEYAKS